MPVSNLKDCDVKINNVSISHYITNYDAEKDTVYRENKHSKNAPYQTRDKVKDVVKGSIKCSLDTSANYVDTDDNVPLVVSGAPGIYFSGNVLISNVKIESDTEDETKTVISFNFESVDGNFVYNKAAS